MLIHRSLQPMFPARNANHNLVEMPFVSPCRKAPTDLAGETPAEFQRPLSHGLMADQDSAGGPHLLDHAEAEVKPE